MRKYGMSYMGSKNALAEDIISFLPRGRRFVDLFGGGFAISHCACLSGKWESVFYNEIQSVVVETVKKAVNGFYSEKNFIPEWIDRERFFREKESDGYIKYCWSFGCVGSGYLYSRQIEDYKRAHHEAVCFGEYERGKKYGIDFSPIDGIQVRRERRLATRKLVFQQLAEKGVLEKRGSNFYKNGKNIENDINLQSLQILQSLERLERLESLQSLQSLESIEFSSKSYEEYEHMEGDIVYCDPPYEGTGKYCKDGFNHKAFYDWVASRPFQVWFSSYDISDNRFFPVWKKNRRSTFSATNKSLYKEEVIYTNRKERVGILLNRLRK